MDQLSLFLLIIAILIVALASLFFIRARNKKKEQETFDGNEIVVANQDELNEP